MTKRRYTMAELEEEEKKRESLADVTQSAYGQMAEQMDAANAASEKNNEMRRRHLYDVAQQYKADMDREQQERDILNRADNEKSVFAGVTEFANALTNLIGVNRGASNQTPKTYTADWMRQADAARLQRKERVERLRAQQRAQDETLNQFQFGAQQQAIKDQLAAAQTRLQGQLATAQANMTEENTRWERQFKEKSFEQSAYQFEESKKLQQESNNIRRNDAEEENTIKASQYGLVRDKSAPGGFRYDETLGRQIADAKYRATHGSGEVSGSGNNITLTLTAYTTEGGNKLPRETINIKPGSLLSLSANINNITDLSDDDKKKVKMLVNDYSMGAEEKSKKLIEFAVRSEELRQVLRDSASRNQEIAYGGIVLDDSGFPVAGKKEEKKED